MMSLNANTTQAMVNPQAQIYNLSPYTTKDLINIENSADDKELLKACDDALSACAKTVDSKNKAIELQQVIIIEQEKQLSDYRQQNSGILKQPALWFVLGVALGAVITAGIK